MAIDLIRETIQRFLPPKVKKSPSGWYSFNCPMCIHNGQMRPDTRCRGGLMFSNDGGVSYHCFNCGFKTGWKPGRTVGKKFKSLLEGLNVSDDDIKKIVFESFKSKEDDLSDFTFTPKLVQKWDKKDLPKDTKTLEQWLQEDCDYKNFLKAFEYAINRNVYGKFELMWSPDRMQKQRLLIPFYYNDIIVGYSGRLVVDNVDKSVPKYLTSSPQNFLFNLDTFENSDRTKCIIVEGLLDAVSIDGLGVLGNELNEEQIHIINRLPQQKIVCPDRDEAGKKLIDIAVENNWGVAFPNWSEEIKDVSDAVNKYGRTLTVQSIIESTITNPVKIKVKSKLNS